MKPDSFMAVVVNHRWFCPPGDAVKHPTVHRTGPTTKNYLAPIVNSAQGNKACVTETEQLWLRVIVHIIRVLVWDSFSSAWASLQGPSFNFLYHKISIIISATLHNWRSTNQSKDKKSLSRLAGQFKWVPHYYYYWTFHKIKKKLPGKRKDSVN